ITLSSLRTVTLSDSNSMGQTARIAQAIVLLPSAITIGFMLVVGVLAGARRLERRPSNDLSRCRYRRDQRPSGRRSLSVSPVFDARRGLCLPRYRSLQGSSMGG